MSDIRGNYVFFCLGMILLLTECDCLFLRIAANHVVGISFYRILWPLAWVDLSREYSVPHEKEAGTGRMPPDACLRRNVYTKNYLWSP